MVRDRPELGPLPGGRHGLSPEQVAESQRERLLAAAVSVVSDHGYRAATITEIVRTASVANRIFYDNFDSKETCVLAAFEAILEHLESDLRKALAEVDDWTQGTVLFLKTVLRYFAAEPELARFCLVEPLTATPAIAIRFRAVVIGCAPLLAEGRSLLRGGRPLPDSTEESIIGGVVSLVSGSVQAGRADRLEELVPDLVEFVLSPYLGQEGAAAVAADAGA